MDRTPAGHCACRTCRQKSRLDVRRQHVECSEAVIFTNARTCHSSNAISSALIALVEQVSGLKIEANSSLRQELSSISNGRERASDLEEKQQMEVLRRTGGIVKSYEVVSVE